MIRCSVIVKKQEDELGAFTRAVVVKQSHNPSYSSPLKETCDDKFFLWISRMNKKVK